MAPFSKVSTGKQWMFAFSRCAMPVFQETLCQLVEKNGRQFEADGARAKAPAILYAACRCQEVSDVKWASPKTNILTAGTGCVGCPQRIVNASRSRELSPASLFLSASQNCQKEVTTRKPCKPWYHDIPSRYITYARHVFKAAKLPDKFIIAFIIGRTARTRSQTIYSWVKLNPQARCVPRASYSTKPE